MKTDSRFVFISSIRRGNGIGHLKRALALAGRMGGTLAVPLRAEEEISWEQEASRAGVAIRSLPDERGDRGASGDTLRDPADVSADDTGDASVTAVLDYRETPRKLLDLLPPPWFTLGIDEGGIFRQEFDYLIDSFPPLKGKGGANLRTLPSVEPMAPRGDLGCGESPPETRVPGGILLAFGGEDSAGLTERVYRALIVGMSPDRITLVRGPMAGSFGFIGASPSSRRKRKPSPRDEAAISGSGTPSGAEARGGPSVLDAPENLARLLPYYGAVITHFGLTAYEADEAGCRVVCVNPTLYHRRLAEKAGFSVGPYLALRIPGRIARRRAYRVLRRALDEADRGPKRTAGPGPISLMTALERFEPPRRRSCPVCGSFRRRDPVRFPGRTYFRCGDCGIIYLLSFTGKTTEYGEEYFFDEYERQYGRTYLEDLPHIIELSRPRVDILASLLGRGRVLDIGCAYGGFLRAARDRGFEVFGTDISESAVEYVSRTLGMTASASSFDRFVPAESFGISRFDALTMWFVLEHFEDTDAILERCSGMIEEGGILALALPNGAGISARKDRRRFLENSPGDHRTVWTPRSAARVLRRYGFTPVRVRITGHHPERFPGASGIGTESPVFRVLRRVSLLLRLGDTFEIYARKTGGRGRSSGGRG